MNIEKLVLFHKDGSQHYLDDVKDIYTLIKAMPRKLPWKRIANIATLHDKYFAMLTELCKNTNSGYTKTELHNALKPIILGQFTDFPNYFTDRKVQYRTTSTLTSEGWIATIEELKVKANEIFTYTFKDK